VLGQIGVDGGADGGVALAADPFEQAVAHELVLDQAFHLGEGELDAHPLELLVKLVPAHPPPSNRRP
jgi:hypothetical protein